MTAEELRIIADKKNNEIAEEAVEKAYIYIIEKCQEVAKEGYYGASFQQSKKEDILTPIFSYSNYQQRVKKLLEERLVSDGFRFLYVSGCDGDGDYIEVSFKK